MLNTRVVCLALVLALALLSLLVVAVKDSRLGPPIAEAKCPPQAYDPSRVDNGYRYWAGVSTGQSSPTGVDARILNYSPWVTPGRAAAAWTMLRKYGSDTSDYAQVGWAEYPYDQRQTFVQYRPVFTHVWFAPKPVNTSTYYTVLYKTPDQTFEFQVDGQVVWQAWAQFIPSQVQILGEILSFNTQMPGAIQAPEFFQNMWVRYGSTWQQFYGNVRNTSPANFGTYPEYNPVSGTTSWIWDKDCPTT